MYDYLDIILTVLVIAAAWMVYKVIMHVVEFRERWEDLPEETKLHVREYYRHPLRRFVLGLFRRGMDLLLAGIMVVIMVIVLFIL